jgi:hypothetical protein
LAEVHAVMEAAAKTERDQRDVKAGIAQEAMRGAM